MSFARSQCLRRFLLSLLLYEHEAKEAWIVLVVVVAPKVWVYGKCCLL